MRVGTQSLTLAFDLGAEMIELHLGQPPFKIGAGVDARRGVALEIDEIATHVLARRPEEMVEPDIVKSGR